LKGRRGIGKSKQHYQPFKRAIASAEGGLPFFTFCDSNKVIGVTKVDFGVGVGFPRGVKEVGDEGKGILVFLGDLVEPTVVHTQSETSIFFPHKEDRSSMRRIGGSDETAPNVVFNEGSEGTQLQWREGVHATRRRSLTFLKVDSEVVRVMFRECFCFTLAEDVRELVVFLWNTGEVDRVSGQGCRFARECFLRKIELEALRAGEVTST
jgi:hypothetical protein